MAECKTIEFLKKVGSTNGDISVIARSAIGIIETLRESEINPVGIVYLHELVEYIYQEAGEHLPQHLQDGGDCDICAALAARIVQ